MNVLAVDKDIVATERVGSIDAAASSPADQLTFSIHSASAHRYTISGPGKHALCGIHDAEEERYRMGWDGIWDTVYTVCFQAQPVLTTRRNNHSFHLNQSQQCAIN